MVPVPDRTPPPASGGALAVLLAIAVVLIMTAVLIALASAGWRQLAARKLTAETEEHLREQAGVT